MIALLQDYAALCKQEKLVPKKVVLTFTPCGRPKTMQFIKWLGMMVPDEVEERIFAGAEQAPELQKWGGADGARAVKASCALMCENLSAILAQTAGCGVPLGVNVESVSGFKNEIDATHDLFRDLQGILLDGTGSPWVMRWSRLPWSLRRRQLALGGGGGVGAPMLAPEEADFGAVLARLGLEDRAAGLVEQGVATIGALRLLSKADTQVRKTPSWPRSWASFSLL
jgi:hypothetical protein